ncbi:response regulator, partial [bacterium]|nr:response regulator [bacterium]
MKGTYCILDDEKDFLTVAEKEIKKFLPDMKGVFTTDPEDTINLAKKDDPVIFIIDIVLGGKTGMEIYQRISAVSKKVRVIFITGDENFVNDDNIKNQILLEGSIDLMEKPIKWHELAIKVKNNMQLLLYQCNLEDMIAERTQQLIHADRLATVGTMVSSIIHEINSPLTFIKANQEMCRYAFDRIKTVTK